MDIYLGVKIKTRQATYHRITPAYAITTDDNNLWHPAGGVLLYPDRRAKSLSVYTYSQAHRAEGTLGVSFGNGVTQSSAGTITITIAYNDHQDSVVVEVAIGAGETLSGVATDIEQQINNSVDFGPYSSGAPDANNTLTIQSAVVGSTYNAAITVDAGTTGVVVSASEITGGLQEGARLVRTVSLTASHTGNYSFALVDSIDMSSFESDQTISLQGYNDQNEIYGNRVKASEVNQPFLFQADKTYYPGKNTDDKVMGFAVNALPVSTGQFGQYPLFVFCQDSIWALAQGADASLAFTNVSAYSHTHGANHKNALINIDRSIAFLFGSRVYLLSGGQIEEIGRPIRDHIDGSERLAYYNHNGQTELWVAGAGQTWVYNLSYGRWYSLERSTQGFIQQGNDLYRFTSQGYLLDEYNIGSGTVPFSVALQPVHYGAPDRMKHLLGLGLRAELEAVDNFSITLEQAGQTAATGTYALRLRRYPSDFSYRVQIDGTMQPGSGQYLDGLDSEFELRYANRSRIYKTTPEL